MKRSTFLRVLAGLPIARAIPAMGQSFPTRPVTIVVPYTPGGPTDTATRVTAEHLARRTGQPFVILNKPGASTRIGADFVKASAKDGYTWLLGTTTTFSLNPLMYKTLSYNKDDFEPIGAVAKIPYVIAVSTHVPATNMREFVAWARAKPKSFSYGTVGQGSPPHIIATVLARAMGTRALAVHYKGSAAVQVDLISGVIDLSVDPLTTALPMHKANRVRIIAVVDDTRWPDLPEVPTLHEQDIAGVQGASWVGFFAPAGTPQTIANAMGEALEELPSAPDVQSRFRSVGLAALPLNREDFQRMMETDLAWWKKVVDDNNIQLES